MGLESNRLSGVHRVFDPFIDRRHLVRLDRNEDPDGWDAEHFARWLDTLSPHDLGAYSDSSELAERIARWQSLAPEQVVVTAGSDGAIKMIFETYLDPNDAVLVLDPSWRMYDVWASAYQARVVRVGFSEDLKVEVDEIVDAIVRYRPKLVVIANPNQPTGTVLDVSEIAKVVSASDSAGSLTVIDEAYHLFSDVTALGLLETHPRMILVRTFSKAFGLAGLRVGYCVSSPDRVKELRLLRPVTDASSLAIHAALFSLQHIEWVGKRVRSVIKGREFLVQQLSSQGLKHFQSAGNFVLIGCRSDLDARAAVDSCRSLGYAIKGPVAVGLLQNMIRVSVGSLPTMEHFWGVCGSSIERRALKVGD